MTRRPELHILYGIPCAGKSTTAVELAYHHGIRTVVSTDYLRETQRLYVSPVEQPALFEVTHTAWRLHGSPTQATIEAGFRDHAEAVAPAIRHVAAKLACDGFDAVIEGVHFHSGLIDGLRAAGAFRVQATLLVVESATELCARIHRKQKARAAEAEPKSWAEHIEILLAIQNYLIHDAQAHDIPICAGKEK